MSLSQFAQLLDTSTSSLKRWEAGTSVPSAAHRECLFNLLHLGTSPTYEPWRCHPGWWLRVCRIRSGLSIRQAAEATQTSHSSWQRYETGEAPIELFQAIALASQLSPIAEHLSQVVTQPLSDTFRASAHFDSTERGQSCAIFMAEIFALDRERSEFDDADYSYKSAQLHNELGRCLMEIGDHDLAGKSALAATRLTQFSAVPDAIPRVSQVGKVWIGYPTIRRKEVALKRFEWLESKATKVCKREAAQMAPLRSMFANWSGRTDIAIELIQSCNRDELTQEVNAVFDLMLGWYLSKCGSFQSGVKMAEQYIEDANVRLRFLASKVLFESHRTVGNVDEAQSLFASLEALRVNHGFWAPDLSMRARQMKLSP